MGVSVEQMVGDEVDRMEIKYCGICQLLNYINIIFCMFLKLSQKMAISSFEYYALYLYWFGKCWGKYIWCGDSVENTVSTNIISD